MNKTELSPFPPSGGISVKDCNLWYGDFQALKEIKKIDGGAKVIMCSAMGQQAMVIESIQAGAKDFIVKPFQAERVIEAVKKVVG